MIEIYQKFKIYVRRARTVLNTTKQISSICYSSFFRLVEGKQFQALSVSISKILGTTSAWTKA